MRHLYVTVPALGRGGGPKHTPPGPHRARSTVRQYAAAHALAQCTSRSQLNSWCTNTTFLNFYPLISAG